MTNNSSSGPSWLGLFVRLVLGVVWVGAAGYASAILLRETSKAADVAAALFIIVPPIVWCVAAMFRAKRLDELHQRVAFLGLASGMQFAVVLVVAMIGASVLTSLFLGDGEVNVSGMMQNAVTYIAVQPALAFIFGETTSFAQLRAYAKRG